MSSVGFLKSETAGEEVKSSPLKKYLVIALVGLLLLIFGAAAMQGGKGKRRKGRK